MEKTSIVSTRKNLDKLVAKRKTENILICNRDVVRELATSLIAARDVGCTWNECAALLDQASGGKVKISGSTLQKYLNNTKTIKALPAQTLTDVDILNPKRIWPFEAS